MPLKKGTSFACEIFRGIFFPAAVMLCAVCVPDSLQAQDAGAFDKANRLYQDGKFKEAAQAYQELASGRDPSPALFYNLGNSLFRASQTGQAILFYERALRYAPRDADIRANLAHVRGLLEYRVDDKRNWYVRAAEEWLGYFRTEEIFLVVMVVYLIFLLTAFFCLAYRRGMAWGWWRKTLLAVFLLTLGLAGAKQYDLEVMKDAIVIVEQAEVRYGPSVTDQIAFRLGEGLKAYVVDTRRDWSRIVLVNHEGGWVKNSDIGIV